MGGHFQIQTYQDCHPAVTFKGTLQEKRVFSELGRSSCYNYSMHNTKLLFRHPQQAAANPQQVPNLLV